MPQMNNISIDNMQAIDTSSVNSESALGPWNDSSGKFAELINQHQQENSGKSSPKSGNQTHQSTVSSVKSQHSGSQVDQSQNKELQKAEQTQAENEELSVNEEAVESKLSEKNSETASGNNEKTQTENSNVDGSEKAAQAQSSVKNGEQAEHLKLLAMLEAADDVSTEHIPTNDKRISDTELAKMLAQLQGAADKEKLIANKGFGKVEGDNASIVIKQLKLPTDEPITAKEAKEKLLSQASILSQTKASEATIESNDESLSDESVAVQNNKDKLSDLKVTTNERNKLANESELVGKTKLTEVQAVDTLAEDVSEGDSDTNSQQSQDVKSVKITTEEGKLSEKNNDKTVAGRNSEQGVINLQGDLKGLNSQSKDTETVAISAKSTEAVKDFANVGNNAAKDNNTLLERANIAQQFDQNNGQNKGQSSQGKSNNEAQAATINIADAESSEEKTTEFKTEGSAKQRIEQETAVLADNKQTLTNLTTKESSAFKPIEINPHNNIHSTSFVQAETQAASQVIEKAASDAIDAMTQKKTLNLHNEAIAIYRKDFSVAVKDKVMVMISQKLQQVEIRLDPPELGSMHVKVNLQNEQAVVSFIVQNQQAKEALDQNMGKLREMLAQNGVDVGDTNVEQQQQQQASGGNGESGRGRHFDDGNVTEVDSQQAFAANANLYKASATSVDYYA